MIVTLGRFDAEVGIDGMKFKVTFYVVKERDTIHSLMIGNSFSKTFEYEYFNERI